MTKIFPGFTPKQHEEMIDVSGELFAIITRKAGGLELDLASVDQVNSAIVQMTAFFITSVAVALGGGANVEDDGTQELILDLLVSEARRVFKQTVELRTKPSK